MFKRILLSLLPFFLIWTQVSAAIPEEDIPAPLRPWQAWVLHGEKQLECPFIYDRYEQRHCSWPSRLELHLDETGGRFEQQWQVFAENAVPLPGDARLWPQEVTIDGKHIPLEEKQGRPYVRLAPGNHLIMGNFQWNQIPDALPVPRETALIRLNLRGRPVAISELDATGQLWLHKPAQTPAATDEDRLDLQVYRLVSDGIPLRVITRIDLRVSGKPRELLLGTVMETGFAPLRLQSSLPARLEPDRRLRVQLRPGRWTITLTAQSLNPVENLSFPTMQGLWAAEEIWVFQARNHLRLVDVENVTAIDPQQTELPEEWRHYPAYRLRPGDVMRLVEKQRGDAESRPNRLALHRDIWLDFDGGAFTLRDRITGEIARSTRLELNPPAVLGRASMHGVDQLITRSEVAGGIGIEVRPGSIDLLGDSRLPRDGTAFPAAGWNNDLKSLSATLNLPPGWRLLTVTGVDAADETWWQQWTLLDLFLVLIIAMATGRLWGRMWGAVAFLTLTLVYHEPAAPVWVWLFVLAAVALHRVLPPGKTRGLVFWLRNLGFLSLIIIALPFVIQQVRIGLFPVLEQPWQQLGEHMVYPAQTVLDGQIEMDEAVQQEAMPRRSELSKLASPSAMIPPKTGNYRDQYGYTPDTKVQTGPGVPNWQWRQVRLNWAGPVQQEQQLRLYLLSPPRKHGSGVSSRAAGGRACRGNACRSLSPERKEITMGGLAVGSLCFSAASAAKWHAWAGAG